MKTTPPPPPQTVSLKVTAKTTMISKLLLLIFSSIVLTLNAQTDFYNDLLQNRHYYDSLINVRETDSTQKAVLYDIVQNAHGMVQALARNILIKTDGLVYNEPYLLPDTNTNKSAVAYLSNNSRFWKIDNYFTLYPNPANNYITLEYKLELTAKKPVIEIYTLEGIHVNTFRLFNNQGVKIIDLRDYTPGTYLIRLSDNGKTLQSAKLVKQ